ncbi:MAG TPA: PfkB family carbohydrate kinase [Chloroflexota bacterium]|nr:PfkB family carbohydrate kinase [Chloroflexota bacterium]
MPLDIPDIVIAGHVCRDVVAEPPGWRTGGAVYYAARTAAELGRSVGILTCGAAHELEALRALPNTTVVAVEAKRSTSFENTYNLGVRRQVLRALAPPIPADLLPPEWIRTPAVLLAPVAAELAPSAARLFVSGLVGWAVQGWLRSLKVGEEVRYQPWQRAEEALAHAAAVILSEEDLAGHSPAWLGYCGPVLAVTRGERGCELIHCGKRRLLPVAAPLRGGNKTGAGDVFAAAFMLKLAEIREPIAAAKFANDTAARFVAQRP